MPYYEELNLWGMSTCMLIAHWAGQYSRWKSLRIRYLLLVSKNCRKFLRRNLSEIISATSTYKLNKHACKIWNELVDNLGHQNLAFSEKKA